MNDKINEAIDTLAYILACIITLGTAWIIRIIITKGINASTITLRKK